MTHQEIFDHYERDQRMDALYRSLPQTQERELERPNGALLLTLMALVLLLFMGPFMIHYGAKLDAMLGQIPAKVKGQ